MTQATDTRTQQEVSGLGVEERGASAVPRRSVAGTVLAYLVTVYVLITLNFALPRLLPGDPISALMSPASQTYVTDADMRAELARMYGLDESLWAQYVDYLGGLLTGDFGISIQYSVPVSELLAARLPWTVLLIGTALAVAVLAGVVAGASSGWRRATPADQGLLGLFVTFKNTPPFFLAPIAILVFAVYLGWFPLSGSQTRFADLGPVASVLDVAHHLVLPAAVLASQFAGGYYLLMRAGVVAELGSDHLLGGRAKGLRERLLKYRYAARNALLPVVTLGALYLASALTGTVVVETIFAYPGMGQLMFNAIEFRDYPVLQACFLIFTLGVVTMNFLAELSYRWLDPRTAA